MMTTVSVLCVTFNRQHLVPFIIYQFKKQSYPNHLMELIIYDDSKERIFPNIQDDNIKYIYSNEKKPLGTKRNKLNSIAKGDIIVWFDDDDYYFPDRIKDTVQLLNNSNRLLIGCKYTYLYDSFKSKKIFKIQHRNNYTQNNILAYKKEYLRTHTYNDKDNYNEERYFTNNFSENVISMEGQNLCIHIAHRYNTVSKTRVLVRKNETNIRFENMVHDAYVLETINNMNHSSYYDNIKTILLETKLLDTKLDVGVEKVDYIQHSFLDHHTFYSDFYTSQFVNMLKVYNHVKSLEKVLSSENESGYINCTYYGKKFIVVCDKGMRLNSGFSNVKNIVTNAPKSWEILQLYASNNCDDIENDKSWFNTEKKSHDLSLYAVSYDCIDKILKKFKEYDNEKNCLSISFETCDSHNIFDTLNVYRLNTDQLALKVCNLI